MPILVYHSLKGCKKNKRCILWMSLIPSVTYHPSMVVRISLVLYMVTRCSFHDLDSDRSCFLNWKEYHKGAMMLWVPCLRLQDVNWPLPLTITFVSHLCWYLPDFYIVRSSSPAVATERFIIRTNIILSASHSLSPTPRLASLLIPNHWDSHMEILHCLSVHCLAVSVRKLNPFIYLLPTYEPLFYSVCDSA